MNELAWIATIVVGFGVLLARSRQRARQRQSAALDGLRPAPEGLLHLPAALQNTVLFAVADGGHEHSVLTRTTAMAGVSVRHTRFVLGFQRAVRGEWGYLDTRPRFRIFSPVTVFVYELAEPRPQLLIKRRGRSERIAEQGIERYRSLADVMRDASGIDRAIAVAPPSGLPTDTVAFAEPDLGGQYWIWTAAPQAVQALLDDEVARHLRVPAMAHHELVIEMCENLLLVYCAREGDLEAADASAVGHWADQLCEYLLTRSGQPPP